MMKTRKSVVITSLVLVALIIATGVIFAQGMGAVNQGTDSTAEGDFSTVSGGRFNNASGEFSTVGGGGGDSEETGNTASGDFSTISGGFDNTASEIESTISGGAFNIASGFRSTVGGGSQNTAEGGLSTVSGGGNNIASGQTSFIGGGEFNEVRGASSVIPGGVDNRVAGDESFAAGRGARILARHDGTFLFADSSLDETADTIPFRSRAAKEFAVRATGGVRFVSAIRPDGTPRGGVRLDPGDSQWKALSDRNAKENFASVDGRDILERLSGIPIETWNYKAQDPSIRHIGPMAQDFHAAFGVGGKDNKYIGTLDADGVALSAIQGLYEIVQEKDTQITAQQEQIKAQQQQIAALQARMTTLEESVGAKGAQTGLLPFSTSLMWMLIGGLGLLLVTPGLVLGYRRIRRDE
jgi:hypothetical protein